MIVGQHLKTLALKIAYFNIEGHKFKNLAVIGVRPLLLGPIALYVKIGSFQG